MSGLEGDVTRIRVGQVLQFGAVRYILCGFTVDQGFTIDQEPPDPYEFPAEVHLHLWPFVGDQDDVPVINKVLAWRDQILSLRGR